MPPDYDSYGNYIILPETVTYETTTSSNGTELPIFRSTVDELTTRQFLQLREQMEEYMREQRLRENAQYIYGRQWVPISTDGVPTSEPPVAPLATPARRYDFGDD